MEEAERLVAPVIACLRHAAVAVQRVPWGGPLVDGVLARYRVAHASKCTQRRGVARLTPQLPPQTRA